MGDLIFDRFESRGAGTAAVFRRRTPGRGGGSEGAPTTMRMTVTFLREHLETRARTLEARGEDAGHERGVLARWPQEAAEAPARPGGRQGE
jgi:hypothetical protein